MALPRGSCVLCAVPINERLSRWTPHFRAVYVHNSITTNRPCKAQLSGVGLRDLGLDKAPLDRYAHFYDNFFEPDSLRVFRLRRSRGIESPLTLAVPSYEGIPFHLACWEILERAAAAVVSGTSSNHVEISEDVLNLTNLRHFFLCFPEQYGRINWGHDHDFVAYQETIHDFVGFEHVFKDEPRGTTGPHQDPTETYTIRAALSLPKPSRPVPALSTAAKQTSSKLANAIVGDEFRRLPQEIRDMVLFQLSSPDVLALKLASPTFAESELGDAFWSSRFDHGQEMAHVYEAQDAKIRLGAWRDTYFEVADLHRTCKSLQNRRRIWSIAVMLVGVLRHMETGSALQGVSCGVPTPSRMFDLWDARAAGLVMPGRVGSGDLNHETDHGVNWPQKEFSYGAHLESARVRYCHGISRTSQIWVSFIDLPGARYISGFRFENAVDAKSISIGYIHSGDEVLLPAVQGDEEVSDETLAAFELAVGSGGLLGIRRVGVSNQNKHSWIGQHLGVPKKLLPLKQGTEPFMLTCGFDRRQRGLATNPWRFNEHGDGNDHDDIHDGNRDGNHISRVSYPNEILIFGGERGARLSLVTGMTVWVREGLLVGLGFASEGEEQRHDDDKYHDRHRSLGFGTRRPVRTADNLSATSQDTHYKDINLVSIPTRPPGEAEPQVNMVADTSRRGINLSKMLQGEVRRFDFTIEGAVGERIARVEVIVTGNLRERTRGMATPLIGALKVHTNFGRVFDPLSPDAGGPDSSSQLQARGRQVVQVFPPGRSSSDGGAPSTETLIGLYTRRDESGAFVGLGGISTKSTTTGDEEKAAAADSASSDKGLATRGQLDAANAAPNSDSRPGAIKDPGLDELENALGGLAL
ncbi:hypothetical protein Micbo1qcDRAFT_194826 [Microdochium bolleyi]|uniref:DUF7600 domain-containing protein n=1 Tax=Microdochium bolleyi TaxID=196109 RepID=A0A136J3N2_9PEZI|nr:hypothetical protein Micbo1qcDRAFT_194826 [Microdochium bolleyi]